MSQSQPVQLSYRVQGLDCPNCVRTVDGLLCRLPGVSEVGLSHTTGRLQLQLDEAQTSRDTLERELRALGHPVTPDRPGASRGPGPAWYATPKGRLLLLGMGSAGLAALVAWLYPAGAQAVFSVAALVAVAPLARQAWGAARRSNPFSINTLVTVAVLGAVLIGEAAEGAAVVALFALGEWLEGFAAGRARQGIEALAALTPRTAQLLEGGSVREVSADTLQPGQRVQVAAGARVPADGVIRAGASNLDDSPVTGESVPVHKEPGAAVYAGSVNGEGVLEIEVTRPASDGTLARIAQLVEQAAEGKAPTQRLTDRFSRLYTPLVLLAGVLTATLPPLLTGAAWLPWVYKGLALLLIGCPCALVLSVPAAMTSALSAGARRGLLIGSGAVLETLAGVRTVALDKTGTLTAGRPQVTAVLGAGTLSEDEVLRLAAAVEGGSTHPLAQAIREAAQARGLNVPAATAAQALGGRGVQAVVEGQSLGVSSPRFAAEVAELDQDLRRHIAALEEAGHTVSVLHSAPRVLGIVALRDQARPEAAATLARLRALGVQSVMLTGDNARTAQAVAAELGIGRAEAELLPEDKLRLIGELPGPVAMVGDGINDAPALARADAGIAMGGGTDVALETAGAALLSGRLSGVADLLELGRATMNNVRVNIALALGLKAAFLVTTLLGYTGLWLAVLADTGATVLVTLNALRLLAWRPTGREG
ncbi:heavy metal translocating P-type ATPase [Deinococcus sp. SL84]|uniref:heavy metal translocating P-type ATPase n=1 Tax=Deinococcus sp. SL84 TaxID=2994663 RepID=UPI0022732ABE|nr:heavy metal translocating P-type ATPase [Deinococcus sp. SL84]MCY1704160.1 heavy metal translocating P-type ATPase [Deinococcus sp. SL84]